MQEEKQESKLDSAQVKTAPEQEAVQEDESPTASATAASAENKAEEQAHARSSTTIKAQQGESAEAQVEATSSSSSAEQPARPVSVAVDLAHLDDGDATLTHPTDSYEAPSASSSTAPITPLIVAPAPAPALRAPGKPARALFDFAGEATFNELSLRAGECFEVLAPELRGGWSLGLVRTRDENGVLQEKRGLVPVGWYCVSCSR